MLTIDMLLIGSIFVAALLYASVGHGGASGYLAVMALAGVAPEVMKPAALSMNILVASVATFRFFRVGAFSWPIFWPLALAAVPMAFLGGAITLPGDYYRPLVGGVLLYAAARSFFTANRTATAFRQRPVPWILLGVGAMLGLLSGLTGVGGGIFLSPLLLFFRWADVRVVSGIAAAFILLNSIAGLLGVMTTDPVWPTALPWWALAALAGGFIGAEYGSRRLGNPAIQKLLALVLVIAGIKMISL